jgi:hypothetical protein
LLFVVHGNFLLGALKRSHNDERAKKVASLMDEAALRAAYPDYEALDGAQLAHVAGYHLSGNSIN